MSGECEVCGDCGYECRCDKKEKHEIIMQKRRELISKELKKLFKKDNDHWDSEIEAED